jgi:hypothetical protein
MAKIIYTQPGQPPAKSIYIPNSIKYKKYLYISISLNILLLLTTIIGVVHGR